MADDLISRQAALDALRYAELGCELEAIETLPSAQQWISVTERLPENDNDVLVTDGTDCAVAYWRTDAQAWDDCLHGWCDLYGLDVVAWMPLPEAYKEHDDD